MSNFPSDSFTLGAANRDTEEEALGWVVRLTSGEVTEVDRAEFANWRENPENASAFVRARRLWDGIGTVLEKREKEGWADAPVGRAAGRVERRQLPRYAALAASLALVAGLTIQYTRNWQYDHVSGSEVVTSLGLKDGSQVTMGPGTALSTDFAHGARHISLARGEAYFDVQRDVAHPFIVSAGDGLVKVLGTAFTVRRRDDNSVTVTVTRGKVEVTSGAARTLLTPGRQVNFGSEGLGRVRAVDASLSTAWVRGRLILENRPLGEVVAELDRYKPGTILLLNEEASQRRIDAVIDLKRTDNWLATLAASQGLKLTTVGPVSVLR